MKAQHLYIAGGLLLIAGLVWMMRKGNAADLGASVGAAAVGAVTGVVSGAAGAVADTANDPALNPLQPFGEWLGGTIYDMTH